MILVDSNILLDIFTEDPKWFGSSARALQNSAESHSLAINPIIYSEISIGFDRIEELDKILNEANFEILPITNEIAFLAGKCFLKYRKQKGTKSSTLPDFFIGAQAAIGDIELLTRDMSRYNHYFPTIRLLHP